MAIDAINGTSPVNSYYRELAVPTAEPDVEIRNMTKPVDNTSADTANKDSTNPQNGNREITTVTTHCDKDHRHTPACPHTVSTRPEPQTGRPGSRLDILV